jgi:hypothetical protein
MWRTSVEVAALSPVSTCERENDPCETHCPRRRLTGYVGFAPCTLSLSSVLRQCRVRSPSALPEVPGTPSISAPYRHAIPAAKLLDRSQLCPPLSLATGVSLTISSCLPIPFSLMSIGMRS